MKESFMHYANMFLNFQNPASPLRPINHGYQILNGRCVPIMHSTSSLPDELVKGVNRILQVNNTDLKTMTINLVMSMNLMMTCLSESTSQNICQPFVYLKRKISFAIPTSILFWSWKQNKISFLIAFTQKTTGVYFKEKNKWTNYDQ